MKALMTGLAVLCLVSTAGANIVDIPMDQQINIGRTTSQSPSGDAIYDPYNGDTIAFMPPNPPEDPLEGFQRHLLDAAGAGSWWYNFVDFYLAGQANDFVDITSAPSLEFDLRIYEDPVTNSNPYGDVAVFVRLYTYTMDPESGLYDIYAGNRDYGIVNQVNIQGQPELQYPNWQHMALDPNDAGIYTDTGAFDPTQVNRLRFYGTNWSGGGDDFRDFKNFVITPEPASLVLLALGGLALIRRR